MAFVDKRLTEVQEASVATNDAFIHIVDPNDITDSSDGTSFKIKKENFLKESGDVITVNNPVTSTVTTLDDALDDLNTASSGTDLAYTASPTNGIVTSSTGTDATLPLADATNAGLLKPAKYTVLENTSGTNTGDQDLSGLLEKNVGSTYTTNEITTVTQAEYDAIGTPDANTLYFITA